MKQATVDTFLMVAEAARELELSQQMIRLLEKQGKLAATRTAGGVRLFRRTDVERLKAERAEKKRA